MLTPKESGQLMCNQPQIPMEVENTINIPSAEVSQNIKLITLKNLKHQDIPNGNLNGETKPRGCMNILQNIVIKKEDHEHCIQIPIKREIDEDTINNRIKIPKRDLNEQTQLNVPPSPIKEEVLEIKNEVACNNNAARASVSENEVSTCFRCNMAFMEKDAYTAHVRRCGKHENVYTNEPQPVVSNISNEEDYIVRIEHEPEQQPPQPPRTQPPMQMLHPVQTLTSNRALDLFFKSMCETTKTFPVHLQLQVKKKVFDTILDTEDMVSRLNHIRTESFSPPQSPQDDHFQY